MPALQQNVWRAGLARNVLRSKIMSEEVIQGLLRKIYADLAQDLASAADPTSSIVYEFHKNEINEYKADPEKYGLITAFFKKTVVW